VMESTPVALIRLTYGVKRLLQEKMSRYPCGFRRSHPERCAEEYFMENYFHYLELYDFNVTVAMSCNNFVFKIVFCFQFRQAVGCEDDSIGVVLSFLYQLCKAI
jgi:hypothetical protein